jgi:cytochrome P450
MEFNPFSPQYFGDPFDTYRWLRDEHPVYHNEEIGFWALSRFDDVTAAAADPQTFSSARGVNLDQLLDPNFGNPGGAILIIDPPEHTRYRRTVSRVFTPRAVAALEPMVRQVIQERLEPVSGRDRFDGIQDFATHFPIEIISSMLGVPMADRPSIQSWTNAMLHRDSAQVMADQENVKAGLDMLLYFLELIKERRQQPSDDMISQLCQVGDDGDIEPMTDDGIATFAAILAMAGSETETKVVGASFVLFSRHPELWQRLVHDPGRIPGAVEEVVRYWSPAQYIGRSTTSDVTLHGVTIPAGSPVLLVFGSANRDERAFERADEFDIDRPHQRSVGFGHGIHSCLGAALARLESRVAFEELGLRFPTGFQVDEARTQRVQMTNVWGYSHVPLSIR